MTKFICPGCDFLNKEKFAIPFYNTFKCQQCKSSLDLIDDPKLIQLLTIFACHNKQGYRCQFCRRFIPHPIDNSSQIICPYLDCAFVGKISDLQKMHHPKSKELLVEFFPTTSKLDLIGKPCQIKEIIESQYNNISYTCDNLTLKNKSFVYQSFLNLLDDDPNKLTEYLLGTKQHLGFQHKLF